MYKNHKNMHKIALAYLDVLGPPNSPPIATLLRIKMMKQQMATIKNTKTEKAISPAGTV